MINELGNNLDIVILTQTGQDWQTYATWYSIWKNLPEAKVQILCRRNQQVPFQYFQWVHRLKIEMSYISADVPVDPLHLSNLLDPRRSASNVLFVDALTLAVNSFDEEILTILNDSTYDILQNQHSFFSHLQNHTEAWENKLLLGESQCRMDERELIHEAKDSNRVFPLITITKGCGRWIDTMKGCPLANAGSLVSDNMTVNEHRVIELWRKMATLYSAVQ